MFDMVGRGMGCRLGLGVEFKSLDAEAGRFAEQLLHGLSVPWPNSLFVLLFSLSLSKRTRTTFWGAMIAV